jgi:hypothetical protein
METVKATFRSSSLLIPCPKCQAPMGVFMAVARCENSDCEDVGVEYTVEIPSIEVGIQKVVL